MKEAELLKFVKELEKRPVRDECACDPRQSSAFF